MYVDSKRFQHKIQYVDHPLPIKLTLFTYQFKIDIQNSNYIFHLK